MQRKRCRRCCNLAALLTQEFGRTLGTFNIVQPNANRISVEYARCRQPKLLFEFFFL